MHGDGTAVRTQTVVVRTKESRHVVVPSNHSVTSPDRPQLKSLQGTPTLALVLPQPIRDYAHGLFSSRSMATTAAMAVPFLSAAPPLSSIRAYCALGQILLHMDMPLP